MSDLPGLGLDSPVDGVMTRTLHRLDTGKGDEDAVRLMTRYETR
ncbi:hypothetical protein [Methyloversatilis sp.]